jgi:hypothetical protein
MRETALCQGFLSLSFRKFAYPWFQDRQLFLQEHYLYWGFVVVPNLLRMEHAVVSHLLLNPCTR